MESSIVFFQYQPFQFYSLFWSDVEKNTKNSGEERVTAKSKPMMNLVSRCSERTPVALSSTDQKARRKPDTKVKLFRVRKLRSTIERGDPLYAHTHQATQNEILIQLGLLKSGNLMSWWTIEPRDPLFAHSKRTNSLLKSMDKFLHRSRIRIVVGIQIILAQGEWSSAKEARTALKRCSERQRLTFCNMVNMCVFHIASICIHGGEFLRHMAFHKKYRRSHNETNVRHIWEIDIRTVRWDLWSENN